MNDFIELGHISGFFGVKGWVKLYSHTRPRIGIADYKEFYVGTDKQPVSFTSIKAQGKYIVGHLKGIDSREMADAFLGKALFVKGKDLPKLDNEYYWHELIGLTVINQQGEILGNITEMMETGANDVMVIHNAQQSEILIPYAMDHFVMSVDIDSGEMLVNWVLDEGEDGNDAS